MSRVFWDTMMFIYLLEGHEEYSDRVEELLNRSRRRRDTLFTSHLALGELMAGSERFDQPLKIAGVQKTLKEIGFSFLAFDQGAVKPFSVLRGREKLGTADSIHLACASSAGIDLFLTGDKRLHKLIVSGIQFIADFNNPIL
jgi:predicted nucleic acid-binding protein